MKKKLISLVLVIALAFSLAIPAMAAAPSTMSEERQAELKAELRQIITGQTESVVGFVGGLIDDATVKDLVKGMITGMLDPNNLGGTVGDLLGSLIGGAIGGSLGFDLPDFDLGGIINGIVANDIVNAVLTSDFLAKVIDRSIDNILDSIDIMDIAISVMTEGMIDQLTEDIWNNGNPSSSTIFGVQTGNWNNTAETWNSGVITAAILLRLGGSALSGNFEDYIDFNNIDWLSLIPDWDVLLGAIWDAVVETALEYFEDFKADLIAQVEAAIGDIIYQAKAKLAAEINGYFCAEVVTADMSCEEMMCAIEAWLCDMVAGAKEQLRAEIKAAITAKLVALKKDIHKCIHSFIDKLIEKCCKCCDGGGDVYGEFAMMKMVVDGEAKIEIWFWLEDQGYSMPQISAILEDMTFELYQYDVDNNVIGAKVAEGKVDVYNEIVFVGEFGPGWYIVREVLGEVASAIFNKADDLLVYFNGKSASIPGEEPQTIAEGTTFTIEQFTDMDVRRPVQVLYSQDGGATTSFYLRTVPKLDPDVLGLPSTPNGGGALETFKFEATADDETIYTSFCADIGATGVRGTYVVDETNHGLDDAQMHSLVAAIDFIYGAYGFGSDGEYSEGLALAQLVVWNLVLKYTDDPSVADAWIRDKDGFWLYTDAFGEIYKIEGYNNTNGTRYWYTPGYKEVIDDIISNTEVYVENYDLKIPSSKYVSDVAFLKGDGSSPSFYQQRQLIVLFADPSTFDNTPDDGGGVYGEFTMKKMVVDGRLKMEIWYWLEDNGYTVPQITAILDDMTFELYPSDEFKNVLGAKVAVGKIDVFGEIAFEGSFGPGWYLVHEELGDVAAAIFDAADDLLIYFNGTSASIPGGGEQTIAEGATFTIEQFTDMDVRRPLQVLYSQDGGATTSFYLRTVPKLDPDVLGLPSTPNGGTALDTFKFEATDDDGTKYASFCADIGAIGVRGTYVVDETNHGLDDAQMHSLVAAIDYIYGMYGFGSGDEYSEGIALAQLVVWNLVLKYSDDPSVADAWIRDKDGFWLYTDAFGEIYKIEGYNNTNGTRYWYTPGYKEVIDDIISNTEDYVALYDAKMDTTPTGTYVSGAAFLIGDGCYPSYYQQRQLIVLFGEPATFDNKPAEKDGEDPDPIRKPYFLEVYETGDVFGSFSDYIASGDTVVFDNFHYEDFYTILVTLVDDQDFAEYEGFYVDDDGVFTAWLENDCFIIEWDGGSNVTITFTAP